MGPGFVTVVSGLPRSGTSLVMQMLRAGGMPLLADDARPPDPDNPRGYLEYEPVKRIARDAAFAADAVGRAVKIVVPLVRHLGATPPACVLLVERRLDEVIASQDRMLARRGDAAAADGLPPARLAEIYARQMAESRAALAARPDTEVLAVQHARLLREPETVAAEIDAFLGGGLDRDAMAGVVDVALYRERAEA
jgi:hypothetical protein